MRIESGRIQTMEFKMFPQRMFDNRLSATH